jgi:hypothetical protein
MYKVLANADAIANARIARQFPQGLLGIGAVVRSGTASVVSRISSKRMHAVLQFVMKHGYSVGFWEEKK